MKIAVAIATTGRPATVSEALLRLARQTRAADDILVVGAAPEDAPNERGPARFVVAPVKGSGAQRNHALDVIGRDADIVVFVDDDYAAAPAFIEGVARLFAEHQDVVAASGHLIADGVNQRGFTFAQADGFIADYEPPAPGQIEVCDATGAYGCNMAFRIAAAPHVRFDENLPLYAWLEDTDFSAQYARAGRVVRTNSFAGVHLGVTSGRTSGLRLGYSQIANPLYLVRKGTVAPRFAFSLALRNMFANLIKSPRPEPDVDRFGRLRGNLLALFDIARGRADPRRILEL
jgi:GT2 family glycosyltransferase